MQDKEFDKLFVEDNKSVRFMPESSNPSSFRQLDELLASFQKNKNRETLNEAKDIIKTNEVNMPDKITSEIRRFIKLKREENVAERTIRRLVKRKFGIIVLPK
jgi:hypothetical protein